MAPVLDPTWHSPYSPSSSERHHNQGVIRRFAFNRRVPQTVFMVLVVVAAVVVGIMTALWLLLVGVGVALLYTWDLRRVVHNYAERGQTLGASMLARFDAGGTSAERQRLVTVLDRLAATFGVANVSAFVVTDSTYNAALVPDGSKHSLFVTSALLQDFDLIELEGVVAHCLARQRLGLLERESLAAVLTLSDEGRANLAGQGKTFRADEVAAASIRYPLGLAGALRRCANQRVREDSFFNGEDYVTWRWVFFDRWSERLPCDLGDLDDVELRARALEEW